MVVTGRAKAAIRRSLRDEDRGPLRQARAANWRAWRFEHVGKKATDKALRTAAKTLGLADETETCWRGSAAPRLTGTRGGRDALSRTGAAQRADEVDAQPPGRSAWPPTRSLPPRHCCQPIPGERIVGITYRGKGVVDPRHRLPRAGGVRGTARPLGRPALARRAATRRSTPSALEITIANDAGVLGRICTLIGEQKANITDLRFTDRKPDFYRLVVDVELRDVEHLHMVLTALEAETDVAQVARYRDLEPQALNAAGKRRPTVVFKRRDSRDPICGLDRRGALAARRLAARRSTMSRTASAGCPTPAPDRARRRRRRLRQLHAVLRLSFHLRPCCAGLADARQSSSPRCSAPSSATRSPLPFIALISMELGPLDPRRSSAAGRHCRSLCDAFGDAGDGAVAQSQRDLHRGDERSGASSGPFLHDVSLALFRRRPAARARRRPACYYLIAIPLVAAYQKPRRRKLPDRLEKRAASAQRAKAARLTARDARRPIAARLRQVRTAQTRRMTTKPGTPPARREHRPCGDGAQRARLGLSRPAARRPAGRGGRCRRHHRASARGPPPHHRRRHRGADGGLDAAAQLRDGRHRRDAGHRAPPPAACRLPRPRKARGTHHRGRARRGAATRTGWPISSRPCARPAAACRCSSATIRARSRLRPGSARRWSSCTPAHYCDLHRRGPLRRARRRTGRACAEGAALPHALGLEVHAGHGLTYDNVGPDRRPARGARAEHRPFPDRRGDLHRP